MYFLFLLAAMLLLIFRQTCCLVAWLDFFAGIAILGRFLAHPDSPGFTGFSFSLSLSISFFLSLFLSLFLSFFLVHLYERKKIP